MSTTRKYGYIEERPERDYTNLTKVILAAWSIFMVITTCIGVQSLRQSTKNLADYKPNSDLHQVDVNYDDWNVIIFEGMFYLRAGEEYYQAHSLDIVIELAQTNK